MQKMYEQHPWPEIVRIVVISQLLLQDLPGYAPKGSTGVKAALTLPAFEQRFRTWVLEETSPGMVYTSR